MIDLVSGALTSALGLILLIHLVWAAGSTWPCADEATLARTVVGRRGISRMPPRMASALVAAGLFALALIPPVIRNVAGLPALLLAAKAAGLGAALIFLARGTIGYLPFWRRTMSEEPFARLDKSFYSPLCLVLGLAFLAVVIGAPAA